MAGQKQNKSLGIIILLLLIAAAAAAYFYTQNTETVAPVATETAKSTTEELEAEAIIEEEVVEIDTAAAIKERILGNPNAPIKISEHSSFTCSHCGSFHKKTFGEFKARMIDSGQAYLVFSDFPLNAPALHASMVARCLPAGENNELYFKFVDDLFKNQADWAFEPNYMDLLQKKAQEYDMGPATFKACIDNKAIQEAILNRMRAAQAQWQISSTPSFVVNNKVTLSGSQPIDAFVKSIEEAAVAEAPAAE